MMESELAQLFFELKALFTQREAMVERHLAGKHNQKTHGHGGAGGQGNVDAAKRNLGARAASLGYANMSFEKQKDGSLRLIASGARGGKAKKQNVYITPDGRIVSKKNGKITSEMTDWGWKQVKE